MPVPTLPPARRLAAPALALALAGCADAARAPTAPPVAPAPARVAAGASRAADRCENVHVTDEAELGFIEVAPGVWVLGALPTETTLAGVTGELGSVVTGLEASGARGQGAQHITLVHTFTSPAGTFTTRDRAVCAPAGRDANVCRVNDVLSIVDGTGVFAGAGGSLRNHGVIDLNTFSLTIALRGRVCGAGL